jgi:hypothetical protein
MLMSSELSDKTVGRHFLRYTCATLLRVYISFKYLLSCKFVTNKPLVGNLNLMYQKTFKNHSALAYEIIINPYCAVIQKSKKT